MLNGAVVYAKDLEVLKGFYLLLGYEVTDSASDFCVLGEGASELCLIQAPKAIAESIELLSPAEMRSATPIKLVFLVNSIVETAARINDGGGRIDRGQARWEMGHYYVQDAVDPEGNIVQLRERKVA